MKKTLIYGAFLGLLSVVMGAIGDHAIQIEQGQEHILETALRYNMLYAVLITALSVQPLITSRAMMLCIRLFCAGTTLFCFSLYGMLLTGQAWMAYIAPIGGITLMASWAMLGYAAFKGGTTPQK